MELYLTDKQLEFDKAIKDFPVVLYGGARGGGKSYGMRNIMLLRRYEYAKSIGYIFRRTHPEIQANHIVPLFSQFPGLRQFYNDSKKVLTLPNGSQLRFASCETQKDLVKFQGVEMHDLGIEEAGDWPYEYYEFLRTSNRSSIPGISPRTFLTANPGGLGHRWLKRLFIEKKYERGENPEDYHFIPARIADNPALEKADPRYKERLDAMKNDVLRRAFLYGDWSVQAGAYFDVSRDIHLIKPFEIPLHWQWFGSYDYGFNHPASWGFWVADEDGQVYRVHEIIKPQRRIDEQAEDVLEYLEKMIKLKQKKNTHITFWAGHDCWAKKKAGDPTIAEDFEKAWRGKGIALKRANIDRIQGASQVRMYLTHKQNEDGKRIGPRVLFFDNCEIGFDCLSRMTHNPDNLEDVLKVDASDGDPYTGDDAYDEIRYGLMSRPSIAIPPRKPGRTTYDDYREDDRVSWQTV